MKHEQMQRWRQLGNRLRRHLLDWWSTSDDLLAGPLPSTWLPIGPPSQPADVVWLLMSDFQPDDGPKDLSAPPQPVAVAKPYWFGLLSAGILARAVLLSVTELERLPNWTWESGGLSWQADWLETLAQRWAETRAGRDWQHQLSDWCHETVSAAETVAFPDFFRLAYSTLVPAPYRRRAGEFYTPEWLADLLLHNLIAELTGNSASPNYAVTLADWQRLQPYRWLDPCAGAGAFGLALGRCRARLSASTPVKRSEDRLETPLLPAFVGLESNPWAVLVGNANLTLQRAWLNRGAQVTFAPIIHWYDAMRTVPQLAPVQPKSSVALDHKPLLNQSAQISFDILLGNPPWITWDRLPKSERDVFLAQCRHYGLLSETGLASILGGGKKDLAMLLTCCTADHWLQPGGWLSFVLTASVLRSSRSGRGFRQLRMPDGARLSVVRVDDFGKLPIFADARIPTCILTLRKTAADTNTNSPINTKTHLDTTSSVKSEPEATEVLNVQSPVSVVPVPWYSWTSPTTAVCRQISLADPTDPQAAWIGCTPDESQLLQRLLGPCGYQPRLGVNSGGANGVYWFRGPFACRTDGLATHSEEYDCPVAPAPSDAAAIATEHPLAPPFADTAIATGTTGATEVGGVEAWLQLFEPPPTAGAEDRSKAMRLSRCCWLMQNRPECSKQPVTSQRIWLECDWLFPLLVGRDVAAWVAHPSSWTLLIQHPRRRLGMSWNYLRVQAPAIAEYLLQYETLLRRRALFQRYFLPRRSGNQTSPNQETPTAAPFYSMFNVHEANFQPVKVVWNRMGTQMRAAVVSHHAGKPVQPQETHGYIAVETLAAGHYLATLLNSPWFAKALALIGQVGSKSFATPGVVARFALRPFLAHELQHRQLAELGQQAQQETQAFGQPLAATESQIRLLTANYWGLKQEI